jgi:hypothetical protein
LLFRAYIRSKGTKAGREIFIVSPVFTKTIAASHTRIVCGFADAKAVNMQLARLKNDKDRFDIFVAERRKTVVEVEKVMFNLNTAYAVFQLN